MKRSLISVLALLAVSACGERPSGEPEEVVEAPVDVAQEAQRIEVGMTEPQVVEILGEPRARVREGGTGERLTFWTFDAGDEVRARVYVNLDSAGRVVNVETIPL